MSWIGSGRRGTCHGENGRCPRVSRKPRRSKANANEWPADAKRARTSTSKESFMRGKRFGEEGKVGSGRAAVWHRARGVAELGTPDQPKDERLKERGHTSGGACSGSESKVETSKAKAGTPNFEGRCRSRDQERHGEMSNAREQTRSDKEGGQDRTCTSA